MDVTRFRSFAERYVIERASTFKSDKEMEDAWSAVERAKSIYKHIENVANVEDSKDMASAQGAMQAASQGKPPGRLTPTVQQIRVVPPKHPLSPFVNSQSWTGRKSP